MAFDSSFVFIRPGKGGLFSSHGRKPVDPVDPKTFFLSPGGAFEPVQSPLWGSKQKEKRRRFSLPSHGLAPVAREHIAPTGLIQKKNGSGLLERNRTSGTSDAQEARMVEKESDSKDAGRRTGGGA